MLLNLTPRQILEIAGKRLPTRYRRALERCRYGPGVFKVDWAIDGRDPVEAPECTRAATVHLGGLADEVITADSAREAWVRLAPIPHRWQRVLGRLTSRLGGLHAWPGAQQRCASRGRHSFSPRWR